MNYEEFSKTRETFGEGEEPTQKATRTSTVRLWTMGDGGEVLLRKRVPIEGVGGMKLGLDTVWCLVIFCAFTLFLATQVEGLASQLAIAGFGGCILVGAAWFARAESKSAA